jgi:hypothetical protein
MEIGRFIRELRRVENNPYLFVCKHKGQAAAWKVHFMCWQIWDQNPATGSPYPVRPIATRDGLPREPTDIDFRVMANGRLENVCQGRASWDEVVANAAPAEREAAIAKKMEEYTDMARREMWPKAWRILGHGKLLNLGGIDESQGNRRSRKAEAKRRKGKVLD